MQKKTIKMAVDQCTTNAGWAIGDGEKIVDMGRVNIATNYMHAHDRIEYIIDKLYEIARDYNVEEIIFENTYFNKFRGVATFQILTFSLGAMFSFFKRRGYRVIICHASSWKKSIGLKKAAKLPVSTFVRLTGYKVSTSDEVDATCMLYAHDGFIDERMKNVDNYIREDDVN